MHNKDGLIFVYLLQAINKGLPNSDHKISGLHVIKDCGKYQFTLFLLFTTLHVGRMSLHFKFDTLSNKMNII